MSTHYVASAEQLSTGLAILGRPTDRDERLRRSRDPAAPWLQVRRHLGELADRHGLAARRAERPTVTASRLALHGLLATDVARAIALLDQSACRAGEDPGMGPSFARVADRLARHLELRLAFG